MLTEATPEHAIPEHAIPEHAIPEHVTPARSASPLYSAFAGSVLKHPDAPALGGAHGQSWQTITYRQALETIDTLANILAHQGVRLGQRVIVWMPHGPRIPLCLFALWKIGAIAIPLDKDTSSNMVSGIIQKTEPVLILYGYSQKELDTFLSGVTSATPPDHSAVPCVSADQLFIHESMALVSQRSAYPVSSVSRDHDALDGPDVTDDTNNSRPSDVIHDANDPLALIMFTSGTTGDPKGCMISHRNIMFEATALRTRIDLGVGTRVASILPLSHMFELTCGMVFPLLSGAAIHYIPTRRKSDILWVLQDQKITIMPVVPQLLTILATGIDQALRKKMRPSVYNIIHALAPHLPMRVRRLLFFPIHRQLGGHLDLLVSGGAALPVETAQFWTRMGVRVVQGYGASELSPVVACGSSQGDTPFDSVGTVLPGVQITLSDDGELLVRGPNVMKGYWKDDKKTAEVLHDGWYSTGDLVTIDDHQHLRIVGRVRDLIVLPNGMNVWPQDIEHVFTKEAAIKDAAVCARPVNGGGLSLHVYLLAHEGTQKTHELSQEILKKANKALSSHQKVASASWWDQEDFPRTALGKVRRQLLVDQPPAVVTPSSYPSSIQGLSPSGPTSHPDKPTTGRVENGADSTVAQKSVPSHESVEQMLLSVLQRMGKEGKEPILSLDTTLGSLGYDSLTIVNLLLELETEAETSFDDDDFTVDMTLRDMATVIYTAIRSHVDPTVGKAITPHFEENGSHAAPQPPLNREHVRQPIIYHENSIAARPASWPYTWGRAFRFVSLPFDLLYRLSVPQTIIEHGDYLRQGLELAAESRTSLVFAGPHRGFGDVPLLRTALQRYGRQREHHHLVVAIAAGPFAHAGFLVRWVQMAYGLYPLRQRGDQEENIRHLLKIIKTDNHLLIFPQGRHCTLEQEATHSPLATFRPGFAHIADSLDAWVVPFGQAGSDRIIPPTAETHQGLVVGGVPVKIQRTPLVIVFGQPLHLEENEPVHAFAERVQNVCFALALDAEKAYAAKTSRAKKKE